MSCPRCHGLMVRDMCWDLEETQGMWIHTSRCMNCGHLSDLLMERHRQQRSTAGSLEKVAPAMGCRRAVGEK
jgi:hypothetical protein